MHREITKGIYYIGVDDHHTELFENLWSLPFGTWNPITPAHFLILQH